MHATAVTKITIIFKNWRQCVEQQLYQAELNNVPAAFADGSVASGERRGRHSLTVRTQSPGRHAEIRATHIGTLLVVRQTDPDRWACRCARRVAWWRPSGPSKTSSCACGDAPPPRHSTRSAHRGRRPTRRPSPAQRLTAQRCSPPEACTTRPACST
uniref:Repulsive guidance molecule C-terminal domain-containing protein n=1 Tax=Gasterosteus aculeatus TaxID=69293 RepID=G3NFP2_GASAC